ncbi:MAG TPA: Dps family protein [Bacteroidia bacterium]|nr:Dps family protein [Bacteroidia bacterium]
MSKFNSIGIDKKKAKSLSENLNVLLANYQLFYMNTRGLHWNIRGEKFFELHLKFEELYNNLVLKVDEIAERILTLGHTPKHTFNDYLHISEVKEVKNVTSGRAAVESVVNAFQKIIIRQREILTMAAEAGDEGTNALMSDYIREQEKLVWMYEAYLDK